MPFQSLVRQILHVTAGCLAATSIASAQDALPLVLSGEGEFANRSGLASQSPLIQARSRGAGTVRYSQLPRSRCGTMFEKGGAPVARLPKGEPAPFEGVVATPKDEPLRCACGGAPLAREGASMAMVDS